MVRRLLRHIFGRRLSVAEAIVHDSLADVQDHLAVVRLEARTHADSFVAVLLFGIIGFVAAFVACLTLTALVIILAWDEPYRDGVAIATAIFWSVVTLTMLLKARQSARRLERPFRVSRQLIDDDLRLLRRILSAGESR